MVSVQNFKDTSQCFMQVWASYSEQLPQSKNVNVIFTSELKQNLPVGTKMFLETHAAMQI